LPTHRRIEVTKRAWRKVLYIAVGLATTFICVWIWLGAKMSSGHREQQRMRAVFWMLKAYVYSTHGDFPQSPDDLIRMGYLSPMIDQSWYDIPGSDQRVFVGTAAFQSIPPVRVPRRDVDGISFGADLQDLELTRDGIVVDPNGRPYLLLRVEWQRQVSEAESMQLSAKVIQYAQRVRETTDPNELDKMCPPFLSFN